MSNNVKAIPASLARRLAEAADGFRNTGQVFFVAGYERPHRIKDFSSFQLAESYFDKKGLNKDHFGIFGPYSTEDDLKNSDLTGVQKIVKVEMTIHFNNGEKQIIDDLPGGIDSIFFNLSSFEKFVFPYYCHLFGVEYAKRLRDNLIEKYKHNTPQGGILVIPRLNPTIVYNLYQKPGVAEDGELLS